MRWISHLLVKNIKIVSCVLVLCIALIPLSAKTEGTHAASAPSTNAASFSSNWAGYEATASVGAANAVKKTQARRQATAAGAGFTQAQINFTVPTLSSAGDMSVWDGLGGDPSHVPGGINSTVLVQAGVDSCLGNTCDPNCTPGVQCNFMWWEIADALVAQTVKFSKGIRAGNNMYVYISSNLNGSGRDEFFIQNVTTGETHDIVVANGQAIEDGNRRISVDTINGSGPLPRGLQINSDAASAECIVERPTNAVTNSLIPLPGFAAQTVAGCDVGTDDGLLGIGNVAPVSKINMINRNGSTQAARNGANAKSITVLTSVGNLGGTAADQFIVARPSTQQASLNSTAQFIQFPSSPRVLRHTFRET